MKTADGSVKYFYSKRKLDGSSTRISKEVYDAHVNLQKTAGSNRRHNSNSSTSSTQSTTEEAERKRDLAYEKLFIESKTYDIHAQPADRHAQLTQFMTEDAKSIGIRWGDIKRALQKRADEGGPKKNLLADAKWCIRGSS